MNDRPLRCGVIGVGRMGMHHARVYAETEGVELVGVVDVDPQRRSAAHARWGVKAFETIDELLQEHIDAASVATPTSSHRSVAEPLLEAKVACLIEKPLAPDVEEARAIGSRGVDLIITDHHEPLKDGRIPSALAVIDPKLGESWFRESPHPPDRASSTRW